MTDLDALARLREPFPADAVSKLPKGKEDKEKRTRCNVCKGYHDPSMFHLDYVGHAAITDRLLNVDPTWTWEPFATDEHGAPLMERTDQGAPVGLWIRLTVAGMTRIGYGSVEPGKPEAVKELIGDALRNAAMRFGCALDLWHKGDLPEMEEPVTYATTDELSSVIAVAGDLNWSRDDVWSWLAKRAHDAGYRVQSDWKTVDVRAVEDLSAHLQTAEAKAVTA